MKIIPEGESESIVLAFKVVSDCERGWNRSKTTLAFNWARHINKRFHLRIDISNYKRELQIADTFFTT